MPWVAKFEQALVVCAPDPARSPCPGQALSTHRRAVELSRETSWLEKIRREVQVVEGGVVDLYR